VARLLQEEPLVTVELRPPPADLDSDASMDAWIDTHHAVRRLTRAGRYVFLTDNAVGAAEEENLSHLGANLPEDADRSRVVPFLTSKHSLEYCLMHAERARVEGFPSLVVLGGDRDVGPPRCVPHAYLLRGRIRERVPDLALGGWANPHRDPAEQVRWLQMDEAGADFFLTQVVSHHSVHRVEAFVEEAGRSGLSLPGIFGVFHYRSANPSTLGRLGAFFPVPAEGIAADFASGASPEEVTARTIRALRSAGARHVYVSNLGVRRPAATLARILERV
jgi:5,10-methylenetetrahydrofolate reductase